MSLLSRRVHTDKSLQICFRYADQVSVGDQILAEGNDEMIPRKVLNVSYFMEQGKSKHQTIEFFSNRSTISQ